MHLSTHTHTLTYTYMAVGRGALQHARGDPCYSLRESYMQKGSRGDSIVWILTRLHFLTPTHTDTCKRTQTYASCAIEEFEWTGKKMLFSQQSHRSTTIRLIRPSACSTTDSQRITLITPLLYRTVNTWQLPGEKLSLHCKFFRKCIKFLFCLNFICIG